jgi:hypothetical protein
MQADELIILKRYHNFKNLYIEFNSELNQIKMKINFYFSKPRDQLAKICKGLKIICEINFFKGEGKLFSNKFCEIFLRSKVMPQELGT